MKKVLVLVLASMLVACGNSPKDIMKKELASAERLVDALASKDSLQDKEDALDAEIKKMKDLVSDARALSGDYEPADFYKASVAVSNEDNAYALGMVLDSKDWDKEFSSEYAGKLGEYMKATMEVNFELRKSCGVKD